MKALTRVLKDKEFVKVLIAFVFAMGLLGALQVWAQATAVVAPPTFLDGILAWIKGLNAGVVGGVLAVVEVVLRVIPSSKALSVLVPVKYVLDGVGTLFQWASGLMSVLITSLNNVTPPAP